jgi:hypothetical protein
MVYGYRICLLFFFFCVSGFVAAQESIHVAFGGNSWVIDGKNEKVEENGISGWTSTSARIETYVKLKNTGKVKLSLVAKIIGKSKIRITISGKSKEIELTQNPQKRYETGVWDITEPGYQKIELSGISKTGETFAIPSEWILEGEAIAEESAFVRDSKDNYFYWGRRGPSVHLNYAVHAEEKTEWFYNEVTVPEKQDVIGSYFMANGFGEGYFGMQVNSDHERRILFSVWSPFKTDDPKSIPKDKQIVLLGKGEGVHTGEFGNEGAGGQSYLKYSWKAGNTYRFLLRGKPSVDSATTYTAYFFAPEENGWRLIASFKRPKTETYLKKLHSFLENFVPETGNLGRMVYFGNQWICNSDGQWKELDQARFSADATARKGYRMDYAGGVNKDYFYLKNCGFFNDNTEIGTELTRNKMKKAPEINFGALPAK